MTVLYALSTVLMIAYAAIFTLLSQMRSEFGFTEGGIGLIAGSAFLAGFVAQLVLSRYADSGHGQRLMRLGIACALVGGVWMCFAESLWAWIAARLVLGFGAGCVRPAMRRLAFVLDPQRAGETLGKLAAWEMVGFLVGPVLASMLFEYFGIRAPFAGVVLLLVVLIPFVFRVEIPGSEAPLAGGMRELLGRPAMRSCIALGVALFLAIGIFDAIWAVFVADLGASQMFIGISMSLFTLPMILIAPWAGRLAARRHVLNMLTVTLSCAMLAMFSYGFVSSIWWLCIPLLIHACVDAMSVPAVQLAVGYASGENALATGQGLYGAIGLLVAAFASMGAGVVYQSYGADVLWVGAAVAMAMCLCLAQWFGRREKWQGASVS